MIIHKRVHIVQEAGAVIGLAICEIQEKYKLTFAEVVMILGGELQLNAKYAIREERHGDASIPGGQAPEESGERSPS